MKTSRLFVLMVLLQRCSVSADVAVTNLTVYQKPGTKLVNITYDVLSSTTNIVTVWLSVSNGATAVNATNLTGDVGLVPVGTSKFIAWNMATDWNANETVLNFSVWADDGAPRAPVPKTGQTTSYRIWDDGYLKTGVALPNPRFTVLTNGTAVTVVDNLTGLEWVKSPHSLSGNSGVMNWNSAIDFCNILVYAGSSDWRLPSRKELMSLVDYGRYSPALPAMHPFHVQNTAYLSGTSYAYVTNYVCFVVMFFVDMFYGCVGSTDKTNRYYVWPVRGGQ
jgi:hypothetical protein